MVVATGCMATLTAQTKGTKALVPLTERVNVQADSARLNQIIDGRWVAVGAKRNMPFNGILRVCSTASLLIVLNCVRKTILWKDMEREKRKVVPSSLIVTLLRRILTDCRKTLTGKHKSRKPFIIMEKVFVRKAPHGIMSSQYTFRLLWTAMSLPFRAMAWYARSYTCPDS